MKRVFFITLLLIGTISHLFADVGLSCFTGLYPFGGGLGIFGVILRLAFWAALIWLVMSFFRKSKKNKPTSVEILKRRYAKGEISKEEFEQMKEDLQ